LYEQVIGGKHNLIIPFAVLVEVASVIALLTGKEEFGKDAALEIEDAATVVLFDAEMKERALDYAVKLRAGGFDNLIAIAAILYGTTIITNDRPFFDKVAPHCDEYQIRALLFRDMDASDVEEIPPESE
jgi:predicted nucleic acid-binding protein